MPREPADPLAAGLPGQRSRLASRFAASRLARRMTIERLLAISLAVAFCGLPLYWPRTARPLLLLQW